MYLVLIIIGVLSSNVIGSKIKCAFHQHTWYKAMGWCAHRNTVFKVADFNGDKRDDIFCADKSGNNWISFAKKAGTFQKTDWTTNSHFCMSGQLFLGDFNGDGNTDKLCHHSKNGVTRIAYSSQGGTFTTTGWEKPLALCTGAGGKLLVGDFNGDGRDDLLCHGTAHGELSILFASAKGDFSGTSWNKPLGFCFHARAKLYVGDFDGDGRDDIVCHDRPGNIWVKKATTEGVFNDITWKMKTRWCGPAGIFFIGDFNGDGRSDLLCHGHGGQKWIAYARKGGYFWGTDWHRNMGWCRHGGARLFVGDFNGDGLSDIMCHDFQGRKWIVFGECN